MSQTVLSRSAAWAPARRQLDRHPLAPLPATVTRAVLRRDVLQGGFAAIVLGVAAAAAVLAHVPVVVAAFTYPLSVASLAVGYVVGCGGSFGLVASWLWRPLAEVARQLRLALGARGSMPGEVEVLVTVSAGATTPSWSRATWLSSAAALLVDALVASHWADVMRKPTPGSAYVWLWPLMVLGASLTLGAVACLLIEGARRTWKRYRFIGGRGRLAMRRLLTTGTPIHHVQLASGFISDDGIVVVTDGRELTVEVVGLKRRGEAEYAASLIERLSARPTDYRSHPALSFTEISGAR